MEEKMVPASPGASRLRPYYDHAGITLYCGKSEDVLPLLDPVYEICITDPPYNAKKNYGDKSNDNRPWPEWVAWWDEIMDLCWPLCAKGIWATLSQTAMRKYDRMGGKREADWVAVWNKPLSMAICASAWMPHYEPIPYWGPLKRVKDGGALMGSDVLTHNVEFGKERWDHKTPKPLALMKDMASHFRGPILDPFGGSGTTARACKDLGIPCTLIEIEEKHCETIAKRLGQESMSFDAPTREASREAGPIPSLFPQESTP